MVSEPLFHWIRCTQPNGVYPFQSEGIFWTQSNGGRSTPTRMDLLHTTQWGWSTPTWNYLLHTTQAGIHNTQKGSAAHNPSGDPQHTERIRCTQPNMADPFHSEGIRCTQSNGADRHQQYRIHCTQSKMTDRHQHDRIRCTQPNEGIHSTQKGSAVHNPMRGIHTTQRGSTVHNPMGLIHSPGRDPLYTIQWEDPHQQEMIRCTQPNEERWERWRDETFESRQKSPPEAVAGNQEDKKESTSIKVSDGVDGLIERHGTLRKWSENNRFTRNFKRWYAGYVNVKGPPKRKSQHRLKKLSSGGPGGIRFYRSRVSWGSDGRTRTASPRHGNWWFLGRRWRRSSGWCKTLELPAIWGWAER